MVNKINNNNNNKPSSNIPSSTTTTLNNENKNQNNNNKQKENEPKYLPLYVVKISEMARDASCSDIYKFLDCDPGLCEVLTELQPDGEFTGRVMASFNNDQSYQKILAKNKRYKNPENKPVIIESSTR